MKKTAIYAILILLTNTFTGHFSLAGNSTQKNIEKAKNKAIEILERDKTGEPLEYIAEREIKKEKKKSRKRKPVTNRKRSKKATGKSMPSRLELWKTQRENG